MLELDLSSARPGFKLEIQCRLSSPWSVIFGPSGSGKSTLLRLIAGLERPRSGRVLLDGRLLTDTRSQLQIAPGKRRIGLVAQQVALFPHLSVHGNIAYGLLPLSRPERNRRIAAMLELTDAVHLAQRLPRQLSGGEAQRVALARALAPQPRLLLLDEPLSALDASARDGLLDRLKSSLAEANIQAVLVTHDAADALATEAQVALLRLGRLAALGPASEVLAEERARILARIPVPSLPIS